MLYITQTHPERPLIWSVCKDGKVLKSFSKGLAGKAAALSHLVNISDAWSTIVAAGEELTPWVSDGIAFVGTPTSDRRQLEAGGGSFRSFPQPYMLQDTTSWGHDGAVIAGRIDWAEVKGSAVVAGGVFDSGITGTNAARYVEHAMLDGVSIDLGAYQVETEIIAEDEDGWITDWLDHFTEWEIMGATQTPWPAFSEAKIKLAAASADAEETDDSETTVAVVASSGVGPVAPPVDWFEQPVWDPELGGALRVDDEGRVWGWIALWDVCHIGRTGTCVTPSPTETGYSLFTTGYVRCDDGCEIPTGVLSVGGGHADIELGIRDAIAHYDNTATGVADVAIGEDNHGIWVAGGVRPDATPEQVRVLRATSPSGDWRRLNTNLELVAVLNVNVPGFPVPRSRVASGELQALVAAAAFTDRPRTDEAAVLDRIARLESFMSDMKRPHVLELAGRVHTQ